jgi:hypothetical protein
MVKLSHPQNLNQTTYCLALSEIIDNNLNLSREGKLPNQEIQNY